MPHTIRLRGPWRCQPLARAVVGEGSARLEPLSTAEETVAVPGDWGALVGADFRGLVRYGRHFQRPTGLTADSRVWLVIDNVDFQARVSLNEALLGVVQLAGTAPVSLPWSSELVAQPCPARFPITSLLAPRNELVIQVLLPADLEIGAIRGSRSNQPGGLIGLVRLEIGDRLRSDLTTKTQRA